MSTFSIKNRKWRIKPTSYGSTIKLLQSKKTIINGRVVSESEVQKYDCSCDGREKITFYDLLLENQIETGAINNARVIQMSGGTVIDDFADAALSALSNIKPQSNE